MFKDYAVYHDRFHELYRMQIKEGSFSEWLYNRILDDIKDSLIVWHNLREKPEDLPPEYTSVVVVYPGKGGEIWRPEKWSEGYIGSGNWYDMEKKQIFNPLKWAYIKPPKE